MDKITSTIKAVISNAKLTEDEKISNMKFTKDDFKYISIKFSKKEITPPQPRTREALSI